MFWKLQDTKNIDEYVYSAEFADGSQKTAKVIFENGVFKSCHFDFTGLYGFNEWQFLGLIAGQIEELAKSYADKRKTK